MARWFCSAEAGRGATGELRELDLHQQEPILPERENFRDSLKIHY